MGMSRPRGTGRRCRVFRVTEQEPTEEEDREAWEKEARWQYLRNQLLYLAIAIQTAYWLMELAVPRQVMIWFAALLALGMLPFSLRAARRSKARAHRAHKRMVGFTDGVMAAHRSNGAVPPYCTEGGEHWPCRIYTMVTETRHVIDEIEEATTPFWERRRKRKQ